MAAEQTVDEQENDAITEAKGRATPGRRHSRKSKGNEEDEGNSLTRPLYATLDYFSNVRSELNKVAWPSREDTRRLTILCINVTIASALFLGFLSLLLTEFIQLGLSQGNSWMLLSVIVLMVVGAFGAMRRGYL
jgi:preprotein translocase SecE subunit